LGAAAINSPFVLPAVGNVLHIRVEAVPRSDRLICRIAQGRSGRPLYEFAMRLRSRPHASRQRSFDCWPRPSGLGAQRQRCPGSPSPPRPAVAAFPAARRQPRRSSSTAHRPRAAYAAPMLACLRVAASAASGKRRCGLRRLPSRGSQQDEQGVDPYWSVPGCALRPADRADPLAAAAERNGLAARRRARPRGRSTRTISPGDGWDRLRKLSARPLP
jgi:hypothetical protein